MIINCRHDADCEETDFVFHNLQMSLTKGNLCRKVEKKGFAYECVC